MLCDLLEQLSDRQLLGADVLALTAADAIACLTLVLCENAVIVARIPVFPLVAFVHASKKTRDHNVFGTALNAIAAGGAGNEIFALDDLS